MTLFLKAFTCTFSSFYSFYTTDLIPESHPNKTFIYTGLELLPYSARNVQGEKNLRK